MAHYLLSACLPACPQLAAARAALAEAHAALDAERQRRATAETTAGHLRADLASAQESLNTLEKVGGPVGGGVEGGRQLQGLRGCSRPHAVGGGAPLLSW